MKHPSVPIAPRGGPHQYLLSVDSIKQASHFTGLDNKIFEHKLLIFFYLRHFSESRSSSGSTPSIRPFVRLFVRLSATLLWCLVCVICNSNSFHSFIFKLCLMIVHT